MSMYGLCIVPLALLGLVSAQNSPATAKVWGVYAFTVHGDSKPGVLSSSRPLTDYGASELAAAASDFRYRYISESGVSETGIQNISPVILNSDNVNVLTTSDQNAVGSAQAFMQGLYPPLGAMNMTSSQKVNGSFAQAPLDGYQYPQIVTAGSSDPQSILVQGQAECRMYQAAESVYQSSSEAAQMARDTDAFYRKIWSQCMSGVYDESFATYTNAVAISEYLDYELVHNETFRQNMQHAQIIRARWLADQYMWNTNRQQPSSNGSMVRSISPIAGQTLATSIMQAFDSNIKEKGTRQKMTLLFGGDEPAMALSSLVGLATDRQPNFFSRLVPGGSFIFELYSFETSGDLYPSYPTSDNLYVRFLLHNGTENATSFNPYSLFGHSPSLTSLPYSEFRSELETFAVGSIAEWCIQCNAESVFCTGVLDQHHLTSKTKKAMAPAVAGVIGAVVTLVVAAITAAISFFLCGRHKGKSRKRSPRSSLGGFKGPGKLASDTDVSFRNPIWGDSKSQIEPSNDIHAGIVVQGHERLGSWEMNQGKKESEDAHPERIMEPPSGDEEDWRVHSGLRPVKARESV